jgi:hypothetical protein
MTTLSTPNQTGGLRQALIDRYSGTGAEQLTVESVHVKKTTWGDFVSTSHALAGTTARPGLLPDPATYVYVVLVVGDIQMGEGGPNGAPPPDQKWKAAVWNTNGHLLAEWAGSRPADWFDQLADLK